MADTQSCEFTLSNGKKCGRTYLLQTISGEKPLQPMTVCLDHLQAALTLYGEWESVERVTPKDG